MISIIIPVYNAEKYLDKCIESILEQDYKNYECIFVDDGSTDSSAEICKKICDADARFRYIEQKNGGASKARNTGIKNVRGEWVTFIDADDMIVPYYLSEAISHADDDIDMVIGGNLRSADIDYIKPIREKYTAHIYKDNFEELRASYFNDCIHFSQKGYIGRGPVNRLVRTDIVLNCLFDEKLIYGEDMIWNLRLLKRCKKICVSECIWYLYRVTPLSVTQNYDKYVVDRMKDTINILKNVIDINNRMDYFLMCNTIIAFLHEISNKYFNNPKVEYSKNNLGYI